MTTELHVFISSKMQELFPERHALQELLPKLGNDLISLRTWIFEDDAPATNRSIREVYLDALKNSALYVGLFWNGYGEWTIDEFERATEWGIDRHLYVKNVGMEQRDEQLQAFLDEQSDVISGITPKWFTSLDDLRQQVTKSIEIWLQDRLLRRPGDTSATLAEFSDDIPDLPTRLVGREAVLARIRGLLDEGGRVLLQGFGGTGKSALSATLAADWLDDDKGAVLWQHAGSETADALFESLAHPFDAQQAVANAAGTDKIKVVRKLLTEAEVSLVILDDVWDGAALNQVLKAIPRRVPVIVTARQRYPLDHIIEIGRMDQAEALALLNYHAGQDYTGSDAAHEICHQLGYLAFALEIAGKTLKVDQIGPAELMQRIATAPHEMAMPEDFAEEGRTSITELLTASLYALEEDVRQVFLAFGGLFTANATAELIARCMGKPETSISEALITLQRRGLADRMRGSDASVPYYRIHDLAYSYTRALVGQQGADGQAVVDACRDFATDHAEDLYALDAEISNILGAAQSAHERGDRQALVAIMQALSGAYLSARGHTLTFLGLLDRAIAATGGDMPETRQFLLGKRGNTHYDRGDLPNGLRCYQEALELARTLGMQDRQTLLLCAVGKVLSDLESDEVEAHFQQAADIARTLDDGFLLAFVLEHQGYHAQSRQNYEAARKFYAEEVALAARIDDPETQFAALLNLGSTEHYLDRFQEALAHHQQAHTIARTLDNRIMIAHALQSIGEDYHRLKNHDEARSCLSQSIELFRESGIQAKVDEVEQYMKTAQYA